VVDHFDGFVRERVWSNDRNKQSIRRQQNPWFKRLKLKSALLLLRNPLQNSRVSSAGELLSHIQAGFVNKYFRKLSN